jgi:SAM-dependent methyltransferase
MRDYKSINNAMQSMADRREYICEMFPVGGVGVEIGVFLGQFTEYILKAAKPKKLYLVDPWGHDTSFPEDVNKERRTKEQMDALAKEVRRNFGKKKEVKICRQTSDEFFQSLPKDTKFDFVYIDGNHNYKNVLADLINAWGYLNPGGIIVVDDHNASIPYWGEPITRAVADFCQAKGIKHENHPHNQAVIQMEVTFLDKEKMEDDIFAWKHST